MNWVFLDFVRWDYDVAAPLKRPLGGSQSALCYLAEALARRGERVTTLTGTTNPRTVNGVRCLRYENIPAEVFAPADTVSILLNGPADVVSAVRHVIPPGRPLILWTQHAHDQPAMKSLRDPEVWKQWDRIVCVSDWHRSSFTERLGVPSERLQVLRNAIGPPFQSLFQDAAQLADAKAQALRLAYTSTPYRGLAILLAAYPAIHRRHPACQLDVFSSMEVYNQAAGDDPYQQLYEQCRSTAGLNYRGSVSQTQLARELAVTSVLAYPNTFAETSCIAVMEALAAGLLVVTTDLGALPETCSGYARLVPPPDAGRSPEQFAIDFARTLAQALTDLQANWLLFAEQRFEQSQRINATCNWDMRAEEWTAAAARWLSTS